jgi:GT2 family glycosyltransferase
MKYSIVIPTYNQKDLLKRCIDSIIFNTDFNRDIEIIIVCNGCKDGSLELVKDYSSKNNKIKYVYWPDPLGFSKAVNIGLAVSTGEYVVLLNNDSYLLAETWLDVLEWPFKIDSETGITGPMVQKFTEKLYCAVFFCVMIKREVIKKIGYLDDIFGVGHAEDGDYSFKAINAGFKLHQVPYNTQCTIIEEKSGYSGGHFPIVHDSFRTRGNISDIDKIIKTNTEILHKRYKL